MNKILNTNRYKYIFKNKPNIEENDIQRIIMDKEFPQKSFLRVAKKLGVTNTIKIPINQASKNPLLRKAGKDTEDHTPNGKMKVLTEISEKLELYKKLQQSTICRYDP